MMNDIANEMIWPQKSPKDPRQSNEEITDVNNGSTGNCKVDPEEKRCEGAICWSQIRSGEG